MGKTGGGRGTNQYQVKGRSQAQARAGSRRPSIPTAPAAQPDPPKGFHPIPLPDIQFDPSRLHPGPPAVFTDHAGQTWQLDYVSRNYSGGIGSVYYTRGEYGSGQVIRISDHWAGDPGIEHIDGLDWRHGEGQPGTWRAAIGAMADLEAGGCHHWATWAKKPAPEDTDEELRARWQYFHGSWDGKPFGRSDKAADKGRATRELIWREMKRRVEERWKSGEYGGIVEALRQRYLSRARSSPYYNEQADQAYATSDALSIVAYHVLGDSEGEDEYNAASQAAASTARVASPGQ